MMRPVEGRGFAGVNGAVRKAEENCRMSNPTRHRAPCSQSNNPAVATAQRIRAPHSPGDLPYAGALLCRAPPLSLMRRR